MGSAISTTFTRLTPEERTSLIEECAPLVRHIAERIAVMLPAHVDLQDLVHDGTVGLIEALNRFEPDRGIKFSTFASGRIRGAILDGLRACDWVSRGVRRRGRELHQAEEHLYQLLKRTPTTREICQHTGLEADEVMRRQRETCEGLVLSLDEVANAALGFDTTLSETVADPGRPTDSHLLDRELVGQLKQGLRTLNEREQTILQLYYFEGLGVKDIASLLGVTSARVSQLHGRALGRLREHLKQGGFEAAPI
ncbi:MAG: FliA/WhiG family RNA polymerase sigma factor [Candidatus Eremiobacterota bacterium]